VDPAPAARGAILEFGKILLVVTLSAFMVDRARRLQERRTTARVMLFALVPAMIVIPQPTSGPVSCTW